MENSELRARLVSILEQGTEDEKLLNTIYAFVIGPYAEAWERKLDKQAQTELEDIRKKLQIRFSFDDSE